MTAMTEVVILGMNAGLKLVQQGRRAFVEATIDRAITLPLPNYNIELTVGNADGFFHGREGSRFLETNARARELYEISTKGHRHLTDEEKKEYLEIFQDCKRELDIRMGEIKGEDLYLNREALLAVVSVRQWARGKSPFPAPFQRIAGSLIEIGIDYFSNMPGAIHEHSAHGRALKGFIRTMDDINFAEGNFDEIARSLFVATLETIEKNPALLAADDKTEQLVQALSRGLILDIRKRIEGLDSKDLFQKERIEEWGQVIFRSVLNSAGETVFSAPGFFLGTTDPEQRNVVSSVATALLDVIMDGGSVDLAKIFSREGLEHVLKTSFEAVSANPGVFGNDQQGFLEIVRQTAGELAGTEGLLGRGMLSDVLRIIIEKTAVNSELLWPEEFRKDPAKHLLVTSTREILTQLAGIDGSGRPWRLRFTKGQILEILESVAEEVIQNPDWLNPDRLIGAADRESTLLGVAVEAALGALAKIPVQKIDSNTLKEVLLSVIKTTALRKELLDRIPAGSDEKNAITVMLDTIIETIFMNQAAAKAQWVLARGEIFSLIVSAVSARLVETGISGPMFKSIKTVLEKAALDISSGKPWSMQSLVEEINQITV